jgi:putative tryptophan/tyrosine transport system substrate-binding protein
MKRREFITLLGGAAGWPIVARAQQAGMPVVGYLGTSSRETTQRFVAAFLLSLKEAGFIEGQNVAIEYRWADDQYDRLPAMAADLVRRQVTAIVAITQLAAVATKSATPRYQSFSQPLSTRSRPVSLPVSTGPAAI